MFLFQPKVKVTLKKKNSFSDVEEKQKL